jgi:hypothetical protein
MLQRRSASVTCPVLVRAALQGSKLDHVARPWSRSQSSRSIILYSINILSSYAVSHVKMGRCRFRRSLPNTSGEELANNATSRHGS